MAKLGMHKEGSKRKGWGPQLTQYWGSSLTMAWDSPAPTLLHKKRRGKKGDMKWPFLWARGGMFLPFIWMFMLILLCNEPP